MTLLHLGPAHEVEQWLTLVLAIGPFLALAVVVFLRRREDDEDGEEGGDVEDGEAVRDVVEPEGAAQER